MPMISATVNMLSTLLGESPHGRDYIVEHHGRLALREGNWKFIALAPGPARVKVTNADTANSPQPQLYDLAGDRGETKNLAEAEPERSKAMAEKLASYQKAGRTRP